MSSVSGLKVWKLFCFENQSQSWNHEKNSWSLKFQFTVLSITLSTVTIAMETNLSYQCPVSKPWNLNASDPEWDGTFHAGSVVCSSFITVFDSTQEKQINTHLTPAEKLTTGKKRPSVLKFSNMPCTGCPLILKEMLGAPRSRQQLTTSSEVRMCWFMDATARGIRPVQDHTHNYVKYNPVSDAGTDHILFTQRPEQTHFTHRSAQCYTQSGQRDQTCWVPILSRHKLATDKGTPTWPEVESIETKRIEVISNPVAAPAFSSSRVGGVAFSVSPAHSKVGGFAGYKVIHLVDHQLVVPLLILSGALAHPEEYVRPHTGNKVKHKIIT